MRIITLTLNPAYDVHAKIPEFAFEKENLASGYSRSVGGKGINITRALGLWGIETTPFLILGRENAESYLNDMAREGITNPLIMYVDGRIRENITVHPKKGKETRICFKGFDVEKGTLNEVYRIISPKEGDILAFSGSLPGGIDEDELEEFLLRLKEDKVKLVVDSKSVSLDLLRRLKPWLIKPNDEEIVTYFGELDREGIIDAALTLHKDGIENVVVSLGAEGAILANSEGVFDGTAPKIEALSTIGAGDSLVSGFIATEGDAETKLKMAIAYGSAACLREGTNPPLPEDINRLSRDVTVKRVR